MKAMRMMLLMAMILALVLGSLAASCGSSGDDDDDDDTYDPFDDDSGDDDSNADDDDDDDDDDNDDDDDDNDDDDNDDDDNDDDDDDDDASDDDAADDDASDDDASDDDAVDDDATDDDTVVDPDTIYDIQNGTVPSGSYVYIENVVVTTSMYNAIGFFVQERPQSGKIYEQAYSGIYVFLNFDNYSNAVSVDIGDVVNLTGQVAEFNKMTEIKIASEAGVEVVSSGATVPSVYTSTASFFGGWETESPEAYEGVLVKVQNVEVTYNAGSGVYWIADSGKLDEGNVRVDDWWYDLSAIVGDEYNLIQGPLYQGDDSGGHVNYRIQPRGSGDAQQVPPK